MKRNIAQTNKNFQIFSHSIKIVTIFKKVSDFLNTQNIESEILKGLHNYCKKSSEFCKSKRKMLAARGLENAENYKKCNDVITRKVQDEKDKLSELDQKTKYIANYLESNREVLEEIGLNIPDLSQYKNTEDE